jgi:DNA-binding GntR family transcriptional regulator
MTREVEPTVVVRTIARPLALAADVYEVILDRIMSLQLPPGSKVNIDNLAKEIGVSQTPVREALGRLEIEGLVLKAHLIGYSVAAQLKREQVEHLFELRLLLEPPGSAKAAVRLADDDYDTLTRLQVEMRGLIGSQFPGYGEFARRDAEFHAVIARASGNPLLADALAKLHTHIHIFRLVSNTRVTAEAVDEHAELISALLRRNAVESEAAMRFHIMSSKNRIFGLLP